MDLKKWWTNNGGWGICQSEYLYRQQNKPCGNFTNAEFRELIKSFRRDGNSVEIVKNEPSRKPKILYFDIETTSLWAGFGCMLMVSYCYQDTPDKVECITIIDNPDYIKLPPEKCDLYLVQELKKLIDDSDIQVAHFGSKFDIKFLQSRLLIHGLHMADSKWKSFFDTCITAWKKFKIGGKLKVIARALNCDNQKDELPLSVWQRSHCIGREPYFSEAIKEMAEYCKQDTRTLYDIAQPMFPYAKHLPSYQAITGKAGLYCPAVNCGNEEIEYIGVDPTKSGAYFQYRCTKCGTIFRSVVNIREFEKHEKVMY